MEQMTPAIAYLRCSAQHQVNGDSFERQSQAVSRLAAEQKLELIRFYREEATPGKTEAEDREAFQEMVSDLLKNCCRLVVVESLDRLAREYRVQEQLLIYLASKGIEVIAANTGENVTQALMGDPMRRCLVQIQGVLAELDKNMIVSRTRVARKRIKERLGRCEGNIPYGWINSGPTGEKQLIPNKSEQKVIELIRTLKERDRLHFTAIARILNQDKIPSRTGKQWYPVTVERIYRRERMRK
jgi:site-specific DNA recombinase